MTSGLRGPMIAGLTILASAVGPGGAETASAGTFESILVDGDFGDWTPVPVAIGDPSGDHADAPVDLGQVWVANDDDYVYVRLEIGALLNNQGLGAPLLVHFDTDNSSSTGFVVHGIGSDLSYQFSPNGGTGARAFEGSPGDDQAALLGHGAIGAYSLPTVASTEFELRVRRDTYLPLQDKAAFEGTTFRLVLEARDSGGNTEDLAPDASGGLLYTLAAGSQPSPPDNDLARGAARHVRVMNYNIQSDGLFDGGRQAQLIRIFQAIQPDVIGIQEVWNHDETDVAAWFDTNLPLGGGASWFAAKGGRSQVTVSRWPFTVHVLAPGDELCTLIDLPDADYDHDFYLIDSHFKCCGTIGDSNDQQRQEAADRIIAWTRDLQNPGGLADLAEGTPIVHIGDLNLVGGPQPLVTLLTGDIVDNSTYGPDFPPDWDGTDNESSGPSHQDSQTFFTWRSDFSTFAPGKLDYIIYTGSAVELGNHFILDTQEMSPGKLALLGLQSDDTHQASDHLPVVQDFEPDPDTATSGGVPPVATSRIESATPNPFNPSTLITYSLPRSGDVRLRIYDLRGALVRSVLDQFIPAGRYASPWDGRDESGRLAGSGVYNARLEVRTTAGVEVATYKLVMIK